MGIYAFKMPDIGEGVVEGEVVAWHVEIGATVKEDDPILDVMTDKATVTIPSPVDGVVRTRKGNVGDILAVGHICISFDIDGDGNSSEDETSEPEPEVKKKEEKEAKVEVKEPKHEVVEKAPGARPLASPAVRKRANEAGIDLESVNGSGPAGRITQSDLDSWKDAGSPVAAAGPSRRALSGTTEVPVIGLRRKIAEQMHKSYSKIAHFSYFEEIDVTNLRTCVNTSMQTAQREHPS